MKNDFDNLILKYLSIYNEEYSIEDEESKYYKDIGDEYQPHMDDIHRHEDDRYQQKADAEEYDASPEICPECEGDMYNGKCVTCDSNEDHEDNNSNNGEDCPECENEGCVDKNGHCHYCNPEDEEPEAGREYGEDELPPPPPITRPTVY